MITVLHPHDPPDRFPDPAHAVREPNGLLAIGGDLSLPRLVAAYQRGIFPWYNSGEPILWWSPDPRAILLPTEIHVSRRLRRRMRETPYRVSLNEAFHQVVAACAAPRHSGPGTWLVPEMQQAYGRLHRHGLAHSIELWQDTELVGGLYGVALGQAFFGESMFSRVPDASKMLLVILGQQLARRGYRFIDGQVASDHLLRMGAQLWARERFLQELALAISQTPSSPLTPLDADLLTPAGAVSKHCAPVEQEPAM
jgi:leucyl/phenylalanyl-tRNA--protein transferase